MASRPPESKIPDPLPAGPRSAGSVALRIALVAEDLRPPLDEGAKKASFHLICALKDNGAEVSTLTCYPSPLLEEVLPLPRNKLLLGSSFARSLTSQAPDVMLYIPTSSGTLGAFVRAAMLKLQARGIPLALLTLQYRKLPAFARQLGVYRQADIVFTQSEASATVFRSVGCETHVLPGAVDSRVFRPVSRDEKSLLRAQYGFQDADRIVLHIGHCNRDRNVAVLGRLARSGFKAMMVASTSTAIDPGLLHELQESGVTVIREFAGSIQHYYQMADCYLFPVISTSSAIDAPLSVLEAMACDLPVVTSRFGSLPALFEPGNGLYYADSEAEMLELVERAVGEPGCSTASKVSPFTWDRVAAAVLKALREHARP